jgi:ABC-2 type transport system permease protein
MTVLTKLTTVLTKLTAAEVRLFLREPIGVFFTIAFPAVLVGILGSVGDFREAKPELGGARVIDLYVTITITLILAMLSLQMMPGWLAAYRERGILRRLSTTPVPPVLLLAAQLLMNLLVTIASVVLVIGFAWLAFSVPVPKQLVGFVVALLLSAAAAAAVGLLIAALAPSGKAAQAIGVVSFFPVMFFAGLYTPREAMGSVLRRIGDFTPLGAGEQALRDAAAGAWPHLGNLAVLATYVVVCGLVAARVFRWE